MLLLHWWFKNAQAARWKLLPGENYHQVKDWGAGRELPTSQGVLPGGQEEAVQRCIASLSSLLSPSEGAGQSKPFCLVYLCPARQEPRSDNQVSHGLSAGAGSSW